MTLFGRTNQESAPAPSAPVASGKGRPTPSRKEAEAAAKERARSGADKKVATKVLREKRSEANRKMREGMKAGDERYLPARDQGPVKAFVRNWVDSRITFIELLLPLLLVMLILGQVGTSHDPNHPSLTTRISTFLWTASIVLLLLDVIMTRFRLRKALKAQFPDEDLRGTTFYALVRSMQTRPLRMPKAKVKIGGKPK
ncbi:MAG: rane protein [Marmoricola sp.]|nr:rane protein [Marmoricola sp.]